jgi:hypothetical protein
MARKVNDIQNQIQTNLVSNFADAGITLDITNWSKRNIMRLFCFTMAVIIAFFEQILDAVKASIETSVYKNVASSAQWIQNKMFKFQFDSTNQQYLILQDNVPVYPIVDTTKQIITACSVTSLTPCEVLVKVAKSKNPFEPLSSLELSSAQSYLTQIGTAGINYIVKSTDPDLVMIGADVYYNAQYTSMKTTVIDTLLDFLKNLSVTNFNGTLKVSDIERVIRDIEGVNDVVLKEVYARDYNLSYPSAIKLVTGSDVIKRQWLPVAGYVSQEIESGHTFNDSINCIAE